MKMNFFGKYYFTKLYWTAIKLNFVYGYKDLNLVEIGANYSAVVDEETLAVQTDWTSSSVRFYTHTYYVCFTLISSLKFSINFSRSIVS